jgi:hypothetical protein|tara:strand:+ start:52 stop:234 length:183 start_codon:yes stop_codon:yes gene_type:complete
MIGESFVKNLELGDLILYKKELYLVVDIYVKYDRIWFTKLESMNTIIKHIEVPVLYINKQ